MKKEQYIQIRELTISENLYSFVNKNLLPGTGISNSDFWNGFNKNIHELASKNKELLFFVRQIIKFSVLIPYCSFL